MVFYKLGQESPKQWHCENTPELFLLEQATFLRIIAQSELEATRLMSLDEASMAKPIIDC